MLVFSYEKLKMSNVFIERIIFAYIHAAYKTKFE